MEECKYLTIIFPEIGRPYGKCPLMNNEETINVFRAIRDVVLSIHPDRFVVPNRECPFFNQGITLTQCPCFEPR